MLHFERWTVVSVPIRQRRRARSFWPGVGAAQDLLWVLMITAAASRGWPEDAHH